MNYKSIISLAKKTYPNSDEILLGNENFESYYDGMVDVFNYIKNDTTLLSKDINFIKKLIYTIYFKSNPFELRSHNETFEYYEKGFIKGLELSKDELEVSI